MQRHSFNNHKSEFGAKFRAKVRNHSGLPCKAADASFQQSVIEETDHEAKECIKLMLQELDLAHYPGRFNSYVPVGESDHYYHGVANGLRMSATVFAEEAKNNPHVSVHSPLD